MMHETKRVREISVGPSEEDFETWAGREYLSEETSESVKSASVLIVPVEGFRDVSQPLFAQRSDELFAFLKENLPPEHKVEICVEDEDYQEVALHFDLFDLGQLVLTAVAVPVVVKLIADYVSRKVFAAKEDKAVKISLTVVNDKGSKTVTYEGLAKNFPPSVEEIKKLCLEEQITLKPSENTLERLKPALIPKKKKKRK